MTLKEIGEMITYIVKHMVTKDDLKEELDPIKETLAEHTKTLNEHTKTLNEHTRRLNSIENNQNTDLDKRKQLEVRVMHVEKQITNLKR